MRSAKKAYSDARPYVQRAVTDDEVRDNLKDAFYAARDIYDELFGGRGRLAVAQRVATDSDIHENLKKSRTTCARASTAFKGRPTTPVATFSCR